MKNLDKILAEMEKAELKLAHDRMGYKDFLSEWAKLEQDLKQAQLEASERVERGHMDKALEEAIKVLDHLGS